MPRRAMVVTLFQLRRRVRPVRHTLIVIRNFCTGGALLVGRSARPRDTACAPEIPAICCEDVGCGTGHDAMIRRSGETTALKRNWVGNQ